VKYVGIDVHKKFCQAAFLDEDGELLDQICFLNIGMTGRKLKSMERRASIGLRI